MKIRRAKPEDTDQIVAIYDRLHEEEEAGEAAIGWVRDVYPTRKTVVDSLGRNDMFVMEEDGSIIAAAIINQIQVPEYSLAGWKQEASEDQVMVLHTLTVDPLQKAKGFGKAFVAYYEDYAREHHCPHLRMDTNFINKRARKMYAGLGYEEIGIVNCVFNGIEGVRLVCLEKNLL